MVGNLLQVLKCSPWRKRSLDISQLSRSSWDRDSLLAQDGWGSSTTVARVAFLWETVLVTSTQRIPVLGWLHLSTRTPDPVTGQPTQDTPVTPPLETDATLPYRGSCFVHSRNRLALTTTPLQLLIKSTAAAITATTALVAAVLATSPAAADTVTFANTLNTPGGAERAQAMAAEETPSDSSWGPYSSFRSIGNVDLPGNDIDFQQIANFKTCLKRCRENRDCMAWTWSDNAGGMCWLKDSYGNGTFYEGAVSGVNFDWNADFGTVYVVVENCDLPGNDAWERPGKSYRDCMWDKSVFAWSDWDGGTCSYKNETLDRVRYAPNKIIGIRLSSITCSDYCFTDPNCNAWNWSYTNGGTCRLKGGYGNAQLYYGAVSGVKISCNEPPHSKYLIADNFDVPGNDTSNFAGRSFADCMAGANYFTWSDWNGGTCWLKFSAQRCEYAPNKFTGVLLHY